MEKKNLNDHPSFHDSITLYDHIDLPSCPIHEFLTDALPHTMPGCVKQTERDCCAYRMMYFFAYCDNPEEFARKAREMIDKHS